MDTLQKTVNDSKDGDSACHVCVFGLMGHGKSRLLNLILTSVSNPPNQADYFLDTDEQDDDDVHVRGDSKEVIRVSNEVPSGEGSTTRAYSRYLLPVHTSQGMGRFPFFMVDTIGVKFSDETDPPESELKSEFQLVRNQLAGLDFRERVGAFREPHRYKDAATGALVAVAKGEDVIDMAVNSKSKTASVMLRGGHTIPAVPLSKLWDPDGRSWTYSESEGYKDKRSFVKRFDHDLKGRKWWQPTCKAAILVVNPHQEVPQKVWDAWGREFEAAGFDNVPVVSTHSDIRSLFGEDAGEFAVRAWNNLGRVAEGLGSSDVGQLDPLLVENYSESDKLQKVSSLQRVISSKLVGCPGAITDAIACARL